MADSANQRVQKFDANGTYLTQWGSFGTADGMFDTPSGIAVDAAGNVYVVDTGNNRVQKFGAGGAYITTWGGFGTGDGQFKSPHGIEIDGSGNVWVADTTNQRIQEFDSGGGFLSKWGTGPSGQDGKLSSPYDLAFDAEGSVWVADRNNYRIQRFTTAGAFLSKLGAQGLRTAEFDLPSAIAIDGFGNVLVADTNNQRVQVFVDANGPDVTFASGPATVSSGTSATFAFTANEPGATFECKLDGGSFASCASGDTFNAIPEGAHTLAVRATDALLNVGNPATYDWSVDLTAADRVDRLVADLAHRLDERVVHVPLLGGELHVPVLAGRGVGRHAAAARSPRRWPTATTPSTCGRSMRPATRAARRPRSPGPSTPPRRSCTSATVRPGSSSPRAPRSRSTRPMRAPRSSATSTARATRRAPRRRPTTGSPAGLHTFYVRGTDALGNKSADKTQAWTVDLADHKPDAQIATGTTYVGNGVYNGTGTSQTKILKTKAGTTVSFKIKIENDGTDTDSYTVNGGGSMKGYTVSYFVGATDYTDEDHERHLHVLAGSRCLQEHHDEGQGRLRPARPRSPR